MPVRRRIQRIRIRVRGTPRRRIVVVAHQISTAHHPRRRKAPRLDDRWIIVQEPSLRTCAPELCMQVVDPRIDHANPDALPRSPFHSTPHLPRTHRRYTGVQTTGMEPFRNDRPDRRHAGQTRNRPVRHLNERRMIEKRVGLDHASTVGSDPLRQYRLVRCHPCPLRIQRRRRRQPTRPRHHRFPLKNHENPRRFNRHRPEQNHQAQQPVNPPSPPVPPRF